MCAGGHELWKGQHVSEQGSTKRRLGLQKVNGWVTGAKVIDSTSPLCAVCRVLAVPSDGFLLLTHFMGTGLRILFHSFIDQTNRDILYSWHGTNNCVELVLLVESCFPRWIAVAPILGFDKILASFACCLWRLLWSIQSSRFMRKIVGTLVCVYSAALARKFLVTLTRSGAVKCQVDLTDSSPITGFCCRRGPLVASPSVCNY